MPATKAAAAHGQAPGQEVVAVTIPADLETWRGKPVFIDDDKKLGTLGDIYYDTETHQPEFLCVRTSRLSHKQLLVPARGMIALPDRLTTSWGNADVKGAPTIKPGQELSVADDERAFRHYGLPYQRPDTPTGRRLVRSP